MYNETNGGVIPLIKPSTCFVHVLLSKFPANCAFILQTKGCDFVLYPVTKSDTPLVFDTLPSVKVRYFLAPATQAAVYTYGQLYALKDSLAVSLRTFERTPPDSSFVGFVAGQRDSFLYYELTCQKATLWLYKDGTRNLLQLPTLTRFSGDDESGWYWGARFTLDKDVLHKAGCNMDLGSMFYAAVLRGHTGHGIQGASYPIDSKQLLLNPKLFDGFEISTY